jgi:hypothetical protein
MSFTDVKRLFEICARYVDRRTNTVMSKYAVDEINKRMPHLMTNFIQVVYAIACYDKWLATRSAPDLPVKTSHTGVSFEFKVYVHFHLNRMYKDLDREWVMVTV